MSWELATFDTASVDATQLEYDAAKTSNKRRPAPRALKSVDRMQTAQQRKRLLSGSRDVQRNFTIASWAIRKHLDYVASLQFRSRTTDDAFNADLAEFVREWSKPWNCDARRRHSLPQLIRMWEERRTADGDVGILKLASGQLQTFEGDLIRSPSDVEKGDRVYHGVECTPEGAALAYHLHKRTDSGQFEYLKKIRAQRMWLYGYFDRFDQVRGVSPLAPAINTLQDVYEAFGYALGKAKVAQLFGLVFYRDALEPLEGAADDDDTDTTDDQTYDVSFDNGNVPILDLNPGDRAEFLENKTPSSEFSEYTQQMVGLALKALDIPYSFFNESFTNYSGARQSLLQYEQSAKNKRDQLIEQLDSILVWRLALAVRNGEFIIPRGLRVRWEWVPNGLPWIDPKKETEADVMAIRAGLASRTHITKRRTGQDWADDVLPDLMRENQALVDAGLAVDMSIPDGVANDDNDASA